MQKPNKDSVSPAMPGGDFATALKKTLRESGMPPQELIAGIRAAIRESGMPPQELIAGIRAAMQPKPKYPGKWDESVWGDPYSGDFSLKGDAELMFQRRRHEPKFSWEWGDSPYKNYRWNHEDGTRHISVEGGEFCGSGAGMYWECESFREIPYWEWEPYRPYPDEYYVLHKDRRYEVKGRYGVYGIIPFAGEAHGVVINYSNPYHGTRDGRGWGNITKKHEAIDQAKAEGKEWVLVDPRATS